ncbi:MAG: methyl-accepting chemotaxis protein [Myxococcota bacterium]
MPDARAVTAVTVEAHSEAFLQRFVASTTLFGLVACGVGLAVALGFAFLHGAALFFAGGIVLMGACYALTRLGRVPLAFRLMLASGIVVVTLGSAAVPIPTGISGALVGYMLIGSLAAFSLRSGEVVAYFVAAVLAGAAVTVRVLAARVLPPDLAWSALGSGAVMLGLLLLTVRLFRRHNRESLELLRGRMDDLERVMVSARRIADGDLETDVDGASEVSDTIRRMLDSLRRIVTRIRAAVAELSASADEIGQMARAQRQRAVTQAAATEEVRKSLDRLREASSGVSEIANRVHENITASEASNIRSAERLEELAALSRRIDEIAEVIRTFAAKSEVLALNAALEGIQAGPRGRGFSLVASEMQTLAEGVTASAKDVQVLTRDIDAATTNTLAASRDSTELAEQATGSSREIRDVAEQQRRSVADAAANMENVSEVAASTSASSGQTLAAAQAIERLVTELEDVVAEFRLESAATSPGSTQAALR